MSKFSWSHPFCFPRLSCLATSFQGLAGESVVSEPPRFQGIAHQCALFLEEMENLLGDFALYFGTLCSILGFCAQSHWWKCALDCLEAQCIASRMEGLGVDNDNGPRDWNTVGENKFH